MSRLFVLFKPWFALVCLTVLVMPVLSQGTGGLTIIADSQEANSKTRIVTAKGNVRLEYSARQLTARASQASYDEGKGIVTLTGNAFVEQSGRDRLNAEKITYYLTENRIKAEPLSGDQVKANYTVVDRNKESGSVLISSDLQEASPNRGIITATGNIKLDYALRKIAATARKATYNSKARTILLEGQVSVLQQGGNSLQAESITYSIDESRFLAAPTTGKQVRAVYTLPPETTKPTP